MGSSFSSVMALDFIAGSCGGSAGIFTGDPFDTVKVLMQTQKTGNQQKYFTTFQTIRRVSTEEGFLRLYRGLSTPLCTVALTNAVTFGVYGIVARQWGNSSVLEVARNGAFAGFVRSFVISPIEVVKIQQQVHPSRGLRDIAREVRQVAGWKGFTRGYTTTLSREPVAFCCYFSSFELLTKGRKDDNLWVFFAGGIAGICSWITTYPQDVIKSRVQGDGWGVKAQYTGPVNCLKVTVQEGGLSVLYRGFGSTTYRAFVVNAVILGVYNSIMKCADIVT